MQQLLLSKISLQVSKAHEVKQLKVKGVRVLKLQDMANEQLQQIMHPKFIADHIQQFQTYFFQFQLSNQYKTWRIIKRLNEVLKLQEALHVKYKEKIPGVPIRKQKQINSQNSKVLFEFIQFFITSLGNNEQTQSQKQFLLFIQNLVHEDRKKMKVFKQLQLTKQAGGRHNQSYFQRALCYFVNWSSRFFTISSEGVYYTNNDETFEIRQMIPFSVGFTLQYGQAFTGYTYGIIINSSHRILNMDAGDLTNMIFFVYFLKKALAESQQLQVKRFQSFASVRQHCKGKYYIDGKQYFSDLYQYLLKANKSIFITGWMISPYFCLKRPDKSEETRLDNILFKKAKQGVKINIVVFQQPTVALYINSQFTQTYLNSLHKNIKTLRHPQYKLIPFLWSHHQKIVIIDQKVAFLGGLDIGYGRMDDNKHLLSDQEQQIWPGVDYCNYRVVDIHNPTQYKKSSIDRSNTPRMPWHDIGVKISGLSVLDISRHFVQYWNYVNFQMSIDQRQLLFYVGLNETQIQHSKNSLNQIDWPKKIQKRRSNSPRKQRIESPKKQRFQMSKSINFQIKNNKIQHGEMQIEKQHHHSQQFKVETENDHEEQMQFYTHHLVKQQEQQKKFNKLWGRLNPKQYFSKKQAVPNQELIVTVDKDKKQSNRGKQTHQILRSASMWGLGIDEGQYQSSIMNAYCSLIQNAKQFIYIQNQFFIAVENPVVNCIKQRIKKAHQLGQKFRVIILIPALPGFDGDPLNPYAILVRVQIKYTYQTICRGEDSLLQQLSYIKNIDQYIQFYNLRTHGVINGVPVTQIIYVHSKIMIVDDRFALIGSANINDRSLIGNRDSQIAILIEDTQQLQVKIQHTNNSCQQFKGEPKRTVGKFAHQLRKQLFQQHFGISSKQVEDYFNDDVWWSMAQNASKNSSIYKQIFGCYPDNQIKTAEDYQQVQRKSNIQKYQILYPLIKGNAVKFQRHFLQCEDLNIGPSSKQYYVPSISFT